MNNKKYWEERANLRMATYHKNSNETILKINKAYDKAISDINKDIKKIFNKFQLDNELTQSEAKDLLDSKISIKEIEDIRAKINYIQDEDVKKYLRAKLDSGAYKARITRLEALKESININIAQVADVQLRDINTLFIDNIKQAYYSTMYDIQKGIGIGFSFAEMPTSRIKEILKQDWSGKHYSERVWKNNEVLAQKLQETLLSGFMSGKSYRRMAKELEDLSDLGKFASERLIRTECTYIANQGEIESYKECSIEKYVYVAILDLRTSEICRELDNKIFLVKEAMPGKNLPPMHPYCRSTTYAYMGKEWYEDIKRKARDPVTGELYALPKNMSYKEWYQKFVVEKHGRDKADTMEKMIKNKSSDRKQYEEYKKILGKDIPKSLKEFQEMKYNNSTEWNELKNKYRLDLSWDNKKTSGKFRYNSNGNRLARIRDIKHVRKYLKNHNIGFAIDKKKKILPVFAAGGFDPYTRKVILRENPTYLSLRHERFHAEQYINLGEEKYLSQTRLEREEYVYSQIMKHKDEFDAEEIFNAQRYIYKLRNGEEPPPNWKGY